ncbi:hypothetical protein H5410_035961 [Solanum commersonii]|uniref:Uncharacterized protein n=1 Tax=Solanum commersonii TaxID=4109 RepID=A0A9J5Y2S3_SOLCO|nr:hypothetical protein H5410_035961 [Solanum commersonii]
MELVHQSHRHQMCNARSQVQAPHHAKRSPVLQNNMGEYRIYFAVGFKSSDLTRLTTRIETWFEWVERSRNLMLRNTFNKKTME